MNIQHSSRRDDWHTPEWVLERVRRVLGTIDFDPASSVIANHRVQAKRFLTGHDNALETPWNCEGQTIFVNPPGGKTGNKSNTALFWARLMEHRDQFSHAIFLAFSAEALQNTQGKGVPAMGTFPLCVPSKRIRFLLPGGEEGPAPSHSNVIAYVPGRIDGTTDFVAAFNDVGTILNVGGW